MLMINIALVVGIVVYNNSYVIVNNIDVWNNQEEVFSNIYNKWNISLESVVKYNSNWAGFIDGISCPQDITMSGTLNRGTGISTELIYEYWKVHCLWSYLWNDFKIFYDDELNDFTTAQYDNDIVNIVQSTNTSIDLSTTNIASSASINSSGPFNSNYRESYSVDNNNNSFFASRRQRNTYIQYQLPGAEKSIWEIVIRKFNRDSNNFWNSWRIVLRNSYWQTVHTINIAWIRRTSYYEIDMKYRWLTADVKSITIESPSRKYLDISELEIYELDSSWSEEEWLGDREFTDSDSTLISFSKDGIQWNDGIDDDLNSDNYRVTSIWNTYFPNNYQDDDVVPRKTVFWSIPWNTPYQHVYWNNYKTMEIVENNPNNDDILNVKMWDANQAYVFINTFNTEVLDYDIKIIEFDRDVYRDQFTLLPRNSYEGKNISQYLWYIQFDSSDNSLWVAKELTWNEFVFDFQNKDYAIFFANNTDTLLSYHLESYTPTGSWVYINPIDDSWTGTISVMANHIIIGWEKNFIWENFEMIWSK